MSTPSTNGDNGRDGSGRFTPGNKLGRGNPFNKRACELRAALMLGTHAWIGILEGVMTAGLIAVLMPIGSPAGSRVGWRPALVGFAAMLAIAAIALPISSSLPDGYEAAAQASGMAWLLTP